jgi:hypothetical protein
MKTTRIIAVIATGCTAIGLSLNQANATLIFVTNRAGLAANDYIDWGDYGYGINSFPTNMPLLTHNGVTFRISNPISGPPLFDPRNTRFNEPSDLLPTEWALRSLAAGAANLLRIDFFPSVDRVGAELENRNANSNIGPTYSAYIEAFNGTTSLGQFSLTHTTQNLRDGSAPFVGVISNSADITAVEFHVTSNNEFWTNRVSVVPEPTTIPLLSIGLFGATFNRNRRTENARKVT